MLEHIKEDKGCYVKNLTSKEYGITTGFPTLDQMLYGLRPAYYLVAARPSVGKTSLAMNMAVNAAQDGKKVVFFSIEMDKDAFMLRLVSMMSGVSSDKVRAETAEDDDKDNLDTIDEVIASMDMYVDYSSQHTPNSITAQLDRLRDEKEFVPDVGFIDYIQYMKTNDHAPASSHTNLTDISRGLVQIVKDRKLPLVVLAQLNRGADEYASVQARKEWVPKRPRLSDLKGSGSLEENADCVIMIHRDDYHKEREDATYDASEADLGNASIIVAKNRQGPCGSFTATWLPEIFKFVEIK